MLTAMSKAVWHNVSEAAWQDEQAAMQFLLEQVSRLHPRRRAIDERARALVETMRRDSRPAVVESFLGEYGLGSNEGVALLCIAEALLRIPDRTTAIHFIRSLMKGADWQEHLGHSRSLLVNASTWGLMLTGKVMDAGDAGPQLVRSLGNVVERAGEPVIRQAFKSAIRLAGQQFVLGRTIEESLSNAAQQQGYIHSFDMLGEGARTAQQAAQYEQKYRECIRAVGAVADKGQPLHRRSGVSVKLSALHPRFEAKQGARVFSELLPRLTSLVQAAADAGIPLSIDAEESTRFDLYAELFEALCIEPSLAHYSGLGFVLQAYQKRAIHAVAALRGLAERTGRRLPVRLVKGAYWDSEIKWAQEQGLPSYAVFTRKEHTDVSYLACARQLISYPEYFYPQFATHNAHTAAAIIDMAGGVEFEFQRLHGMGEALHEQLRDAAPCRIYAPVGSHEALLPYLIRRLLENGANTSFVHLMIDTKTPLEVMLADPIGKAKAHEADHLSPLPLPQSIYPDRSNSQGMDFGNHAQRMTCLQAMEPFARTTWNATPMLAGGDAPPAEIQALYAPHDPAQFIGHVQQASAAHVEQALGAATAYVPSWNATPVGTRADMLRRAATALEENRAELMALLVREAGKTLPDALAEVREAADFCRYYAASAETLFAPRVLAGPTGEKNMYQLHGRGVFACISPWNFPLAIFTGQVIAALVAGNVVIAKPAEQTPLVAAFVTRLLHEAGIPRAALQLLPGSGEVVGAALVKDERVQGIAFTGSTATAKHIQRALAARDGAIVPLIAETGGINAMVVDSSALIEQTVDDIIRSAFGSAGQRCSALRLLCVQEDIADSLMDILAGAMQELALGDPWNLSTDIGPVIDRDAQRQLQAHIARLSTTARLIATTTMSAKMTGAFVTPHAFEIRSASELKEEIFGPVLHVLRYKARELPQLLEQINALGYGLTFGLQSRVREHMALVQEVVRAGNLYINRSMIGATVGVQPFGGEGLSGTGPKAGSPYTLLRFAGERAVSHNTAAIGGNLDLLRSFE